MRNSGASWGTILLFFCLAVFLTVGLSIFAGWPSALYTVPSPQPTSSHVANASPTPFIIPTPTPLTSPSPTATLYLIPAATLPPAALGSTGSSDDANFFLRLVTGIAVLFFITIIAFLLLRIRRRAKRVFTFSKGMQSARVDEKARASMIAAALSQNQRDIAIREPGWVPAWQQDLPEEAEVPAIIPTDEADKTPEGSRLRRPVVEKRILLRIILGGLLAVLALAILLQVYNASFKGLWEKLPIVDQLAFLFLLFIVIGSAGGLEILRVRNRRRSKQQKEFLTRGKITQGQAADYASAEFGDIIDFTPPPLLYLPPRLAEREAPPVTFFESKARHAKEPFWKRFLRPFLFWRQANKFTGLSSSSPLPEGTGPTVPQWLDFEENDELLEREAAAQEPVLELPLLKEPQVSWTARLNGQRVALTPFVKKTMDSIYTFIFLLVASFVVAYIFEIILVVPLIFDLVLILVWLPTHRRAFFAKPPVIEQPAAQVADENTLDLLTPVIFDPVSLTMKPLEAESETLLATPPEPVVETAQVPPAALSKPKSSRRLPLLVGGALTIFLLSFVAFISLGSPGKPNISATPSLVAVVSPTPTPAPTPTSTLTATSSPTVLPSAKSTASSPTSIATVGPVVNSTGSNNLMLDFLGIIVLLLVCLIFFALWIWERSHRISWPAKVPPLASSASIEAVSSTGATPVETIAPKAAAPVETVSLANRPPKSARLPLNARLHISRRWAGLVLWMRAHRPQIALPRRGRSANTAFPEKNIRTPLNVRLRVLQGRTALAAWMRAHRPQIARLRRGRSANTASPEKNIRLPLNVRLHISRGFILGGLVFLLIVFMVALVANRLFLALALLLILVLAGLSFWLWSLKRAQQTSVVPAPEGESATSSTALPGDARPISVTMTQQSEMRAYLTHHSRPLAVGLATGLVLILIVTTTFYNLPKSPVSSSPTPSLIAVVSPTVPPTSSATPSPLVTATPLITPNPTPTLTPSPAPTPTVIPTNLYAGRRSVLPVCSDRVNCYVYTVKLGDTLWGIAQYFGISLATLLAFNPPFPNIDLIHVGQKIYIPA